LGNFQRGQDFTQSQLDRPELLQLQSGQRQLVGQQQKLQTLQAQAAQVLPDLESGNFQGAALKLDAMIQADPGNQDLQQAKQMLSTNPADFTDITRRVVQQAQGVQGQRQLAIKSSAPITHPETGQVSIPTFDPNTREAKLVPLEGAIVETPSQKRDADVRSDVKATRLKQRVKRTSDMRRDFTNKAQQAAMARVKINDASILIDNATQGLAGSAKLLASSVFSGIDAGDEAALSSAFTRLAMTELQNFKGPTTDFEYNVAAGIPGTLGAGKAANLATIASMKRANWYVEREAKQFNDYIKQGHDPDLFRFNYDEIITPVKNGKSYPLSEVQKAAVRSHISMEEAIKMLRKAN
jgi:hypothetical protein